MRMRAVWMVVAPVVACGRGPAEVTSEGALPATAPVQFPIVGAPVVSLHTSPDSASLVVVVQTKDSVPHVTWTPAVVTLETDRGYRAQQTMVPFACLRERSGSVVVSTTFPDVFLWESCALVSVVTDRILESTEVARMLASVQGQLFWSRANQTAAGAVYTVRVTPGRSSTDEALRRLRLITGVTSVFRDGAEPPCVFRDSPRPSCPPWHLVVRLPFTYGTPSGDSIPVTRGGRVRAIYVDGAGQTRTTDFVMP